MGPWNMGHMSGWHNLQACAHYSFRSAQQQVGQPMSWDKQQRGQENLEHNKEISMQAP